MTETRVDQAEQWVSRQVAAAEFGVCLRTIHRYMNSGKIRFRRDARSGRVEVEITTADTSRRKRSPVA